MSKKALLPLLGILLLLFAAAGGYLYWNRPEARFARLKQQAQSAILAKDKPKLKTIRKDLDGLIKEFETAKNSKLATDARLVAMDISRRGLDDKKDLLKRLADFRSKHPKHPKGDKFLLEQAELIEKFEKRPLRAVRLLGGRLEKKPPPSDEDLGEILFKIGQLNDAVGEYDDAADAYQQLVDDLPSHPKADEALYRLGEIYANRLDREDKAKEAFDKLAKKSPDSELGKQAKERAGDLKKFEGSGTGASEQQQIGVFVQQSQDEMMKAIVKEPKQLTHLKTTVRLGPMSLKVTGEITVLAKADLKEKVKFLYNHNFKVVRLTVNGEDRKPKGGDMVLEVPLLKPIKKGQKFKVGWQGVLGLKPPGKLGKLSKPGPVMVGGMGMVGPKEGYLTASDFWYPTLDYNGLFTMETKVDFPAHLTALAAGTLEKESRASGRYKATWDMSVKHGHNSLCFGEFHQKTDGIFSAYVNKGKGKLADPILRVAKASHNFFSDVFGPSKYPNLKICQIESPYFKGYAEATLVMLGGQEADRVEGTGVLAHEVAHQWWGNQVSISLIDGTKPWLWEGFASYSDVMFQEHQKGKAFAKTRLRMMATRFFHDLLRHGDVAISENDITHPGYLGIVYQKGAWVLHMLRGQLGEADFKASMKNYVKAQTDKAVTVPKFAEALKKQTGKPWDGYLKDWLDRPGYARLELGKVVTMGGKLSGEIYQGDPGYSLTVELEAKNKGQKKLFKVPLAGSSVGFEQEIPFEGGELSLDPNEWIFRDPGKHKPAPIAAGVP